MPINHFGHYMQFASTYCAKGRAFIGLSHTFSKLSTDICRNPNPVSTHYYARQPNLLTWDVRIPLLCMLNSSEVGRHSQYVYLYMFRMSVCIGFCGGR